MATFRKRGTKWQVQIRRQGHNPLTRTFTLRADAERWALQTEAAVERGDLHPPAKGLKDTNLADLLDRYGQTITPTKKGATSESYRLRVLRAHRISTLSLDQLTASEVCSYRDHRLGLVSPSSVRRELAVLQHCLEIARKEWGVALARNPVAEIATPSQALARERRISAGELERLRCALAKSKKGLLENVVHFAIHTGMRRGEILAMRWSDIDSGSGTVYLPDTKNGHP